MSDSETKIEDTQGQYLRAVKNGQELKDAEWQQCRVILTTERIVLVTEEKLVIDLSEIDQMGDRYDVNDNAAAMSEYATLSVGNDVILVTTADHEAFQTNFYRAILDRTVIYVRHPAVLGGVVQSTEWQRGRLKVTAGAVRLALEDGTQFAIDRKDIGEFELDERQVAEQERNVIEVEHTDEDSRSVQTYLSGQQRHISVLSRLLEAGAEENRADLDLSTTEKRVVMALYSGVSPFAISEFVGIDVDHVEEIYDQLIELDVIEVVRERKDVGLTARGRKVAGEAMSEQ